MTGEVQRTHWDECWREHPACAEARVERLAESTSRLEKRVRELADGVDALVAWMEAELTPEQLRRLRVSPNYRVAMRERGAGE